MECKHEFENETKIGCIKGLVGFCGSFIECKICKEEFPASIYDVKEILKSKKDFEEKDIFLMRIICKKKHLLVVYNKLS